jgi:hypothetical protein
MSFLGRLRTSINATTLQQTQGALGLSLGPLVLRIGRVPPAHSAGTHEWPCPNERSTQSGRTRHLFSRNRWVEVRPTGQVTELDASGVWASAPVGRQKNRPRH